MTGEIQSEVVSTYNSLVSVERDCSWATGAGGCSPAPHPEARRVPDKARRNGRALEMGLLCTRLSLFKGRDCPAPVRAKQKFGYSD
ncbi:hypothetical protein [Pyxidicoccus trucidator]|uniref:hypothetical protein n=1 Tax=Pyxidicoccus trucidator TaxID=2709662 RepID=UPI00196891F5|nr:hypothetical protein [Pyxidicoccus trucidator]